MATHRMHLKGPWEVRLLEPNELARRVFMPMDWQSIFGELRGRAEFRRKFNPPTNLETHEHVWVVFDGICGDATIRLNGQWLGEVSHQVTSVEFEMTEHLRMHNELVVELAFTTDIELADGEFGQPGGLFAPVALEIRFVDGETGTPNESLGFRAT